MDSHDRQLNSTSLFYVLSSRAREHLGLYVDDRQALADAIGKHRGDVPHARDLMLGKDLRTGAAISNTAATEKHSAGKTRDAELTVPDQRDTPTRYPEKYLGLSL